jgi:DNA uptake protein ComE-like DNA-binding protein
MSNEFTGDLLADLGISEEQVNNLKANEIREPMVAVDAGVYTDARLLKVAYGKYKTGTIAAVVMAEFKPEGQDEYRKISKMLVIKSKPASDTEQGKTNDIGLSELSDILAICGISLKTAQTVQGKEKFWRTDTQCKMIQGVANKPVSLFLLKESTPTDDPERPYVENTIQGVFTVDGKNSEGKDQKEQFIENITKEPVRKNKRFIQKTNEASGSSSAKPSSSATSLL